MRLSFAPFGYRLLVTQPCGLSRLALQEATKQARESLNPMSSWFREPQVGELIIQRPGDPFDVLFRDVEFHLHFYGDQGPFIHVTADHGKKASDSKTKSTTNIHHARGRSAFCHQQTSLPPSTRQSLSSSAGRMGSPFYFYFDVPRAS